MKFTFRPLYCLFALLLTARCASAQLPAYVPTSGLMLYYGFNSSASDLSGHGVNGTVTAATYCADRFGNPNSALNFTGSGEVITTHYIDRTVTNNFTYAVWVNPTNAVLPSIPAIGSSFGLTDSESHTNVIAPVDGWNWASGMTNVGAGLCVGTNGIYTMEHGPSITNVSLAWSGTLTGWHFIVLEYVSKQPKLYIDGVHIVDGFTSSYTVHPSFACDSFYDSYYPYLNAGFGHGLHPIDVPPYNFAGQLDDMAIYGRVLTPCEITQLYDTGSSIIAVTGLSTLCPGATSTYSVTTTGGTWSSSNTGVAMIGTSSGVVTATGSGVCNLSYTTGSGCYGIITLSVNPLPNIVAPATLCAGSSVTLTIADTGGTWACGSTGSIGSATGILTGISQGTCHISYVLPTGCFSPTVVTINPLPPTPYGPATVCVGSAITLVDSITGGSWTSSSGTYATAGLTSGVITGVSSGSVFITYTLPTGCKVMDPIVINPVPAAITGTATVCPGTTSTLSDATPGGTWWSASTGIATIGSYTGVVTGVSPGNSTINYTLLTGCKAIKSVTVNPLPGSISGIPLICQGASVLFSDAGGGTWSSSNPSVASVTTTGGSVTGVSAGIATITYTLPTTCLTTYDVTINPSPTAITGTFNSCAGTTTTLTNTTVGGNWSSSMLTVATIGSGTGALSALLAGVTNIYYTLPTGCSTAIIFTVNPNPATITGGGALCTGQTGLLTDAGGGTWTSGTPAAATIGLTTGLVTAVAAGTTTITYTLSTGCSTTFTETVNGLPLPIAGTSVICAGFTAALSDPTTGGTWSSSNTAVATIGSLSGIMTGAGAGTANITYSLSTGCYVIRVVTINPLPGSISGPDSLCAGLTATLTDGGAGTWISSNPSVAGIGSSSGFVNALTAGISTITYTLPTGCLITSGMTVNPLPAGVTGSATLCAGATTPLHDVTTGGTWTSSNYAIAYIDPGTGLVTGYSGGPATIVYSTVSGCTASYNITVNPLPVSITGTAIVCAGSTTSLFDAGGTWSCGPSSVATINATTGVLTGVASGAATVTYTMPTGCLTTTVVSVVPSPASISGPAALCVGLTGTMTDATPGGSWSSTVTSVATIYPISGVINAGSPGVTTISYTLGTGCSVSAILTINTSPGPITGTMTVCPAATTHLSNAVAGGIWSITPMATATIGTTSGIVSGVVPGTATVTYSLGAGCTVTTTVTVNPLPGIFSGTPIMCVGSTALLSDPIPGGTYISGSPSVASVGTSSGVIAGVNTGTSVITYTLGTGCYRTVTATVNPLPPAISGPSNVCMGSEISLTDPGYGGVWSSVPGTTASIGSTGTVTGVLSGMATISYTLSTGCRTTKPVSVYSLPGAIGGPSQVCTGLTITLTDAGGGSWSATSTNVSIGSLSGVLSGISQGVAVVTYTLSTGCSITTNITVNGLPATPAGASAVCAGASITLSDTGSGTWSSSMPAYATAGPTGIITGVAIGYTIITYTSAAGCISTHPVTVSTAPGAIGGPATVCAGGTITLTDIIAGGSWSSSNVLAGTIGSLTGIVSGGTAGLTTTITYSLGAGCIVTKIVSVTPSPAAITGGSGLCAGMTLPLGEVTTGGTWSSTPLTVAIVSGSGIVTGVTNGTATIDYTAGGCAAAKSVTVFTTPTAISGPATVCAGGNITAADGTYGGLWSTSSVTLSIGSATGIVTGISGGPGIITYGVGSCQVTRTINVNPLPLISGPTGYCTGATGTLTGSISGGNWISGLTTVATIGSGTGFVNAVSPGNSTVYYTLPTGCSASVTLTVNSLPGAIYGSRNVCTGSSTPLLDLTGGGIWSITPVTTASVGSSSGIVGGILTGTATVTYSLGTGCTITTIITVNPLPAIITGTPVVCAGQATALADATPGGTWLSGSTGVAGVGVTTGLLTGVSGGTSLIDYTLPTGCFVSTTVTVNPHPSAISGASNVCTGLTTLFSDVTTGGVWSSSAPSRATVDSAGNVSGVSSGIATITYTLTTGCLVNKSVSVNASPAAITGGPGVCVGSSLPLSDVTPGGAWSSSLTIVGTISTTGVVTGMSAGTTIVTYATGSCLATKVVSVNTLPGGVSGPGSVCIGTTITKTDGSPGGVWSSSNISVALAGTTTGVITGVAAGTATITYSMGVGCNVFSGVTVNGLPLSVSGPPGICTGSTATYTDATPGGLWSISNPAIGTISSTGTLYGISGGSVTVSYTALLGCAATETVTVVTVPAIRGVHNMCAYGDTMTVSDLIITGLYTSTLATMTNLGGGNGRLTGNTPGVASVTYISPLGCTTTATFTVNPIPVPISGSGTICSGRTLALTEITTGGLWSSGNVSIATVGSSSGIVTGTGGGTVYLSYTLPTGCKVDTPVVVYPSPAAITGPASEFLGTPITLADAAPGGVWNSSNPTVATIGLTSGLVTGITVGSVTITYTTGSMCSATRTITIMPSKEGHRSTELREEYLFKIWPNPAHGNITVTSPDSGTLQLSNVSGQRITDYAIQTGENNLALPAGLSAGVYIAEFTSVSGERGVVRLAVGK